jgi:hypothetical protein
MSSFQRLWESMQADKAKEKSPHDDKAMSAIRTGIGVREDFWDDFLKVINNSDGLSALLGVPTTKISEWHSRVKHNLEKVRQADNVPDSKDSGTLLKTGMPDEPDPHTVVMNPVQ